MTRLASLLSICILDLFKSSHAQTNSTTDTITDQISTDDTTGTPIVELVIIGCAIFLLVIATVKIGFLMRASPTRVTEQQIDPTQCAVCGVRQGVPRNANIFICYSCKSANFLQRDENGSAHPFSPSPNPTGRSVTLHKVTDTFYRVDSDPEAGNVPKEDGHPGDANTGSSSPPDEMIDPPILSPRQEPVASGDIDPGQCTICMDEAADTVLRPCNHGGIGFKCADALVRRSLLSGGACCPQCRTQITSLIKLSEMNEQMAKGVEMEIPKAMVIRRRNN